MNGPDCLGFPEAMNIEMQQLKEMDPLETIPTEQVPEGANILDSTWAFKCKQFLDG